MTTLIRTWLGLAALGAGLVHLAVAAGSPLALLLPLTAAGALEVGWGVLTLARDRVPAPRAALTAIVILILGWLAVLVLSAGSLPHLAAGSRPAAAPLPALPMLGGAVLDLISAAGLALVLRRSGASPAPGVWSYLGGVAAGAAVVAGITSASLGATAVGALAMQGMDMGR